MRLPVEKRRPFRQPIDSRGLRRRRAAVEPLEPRMLLACTVRQAGDGTLYLVGDDTAQVAEVVDLGGGSVSAACYDRGGEAVAPVVYTGVTGVVGSFAGGDDAVSYRSDQDVNRALPSVEWILGDGDDVAAFEVVVRGTPDGPRAFSFVVYGNNGNDSLQTNVTTLTEGGGDQPVMHGEMHGGADQDLDNFRFAANTPEGGVTLGMTELTAPSGSTATELEDCLLWDLIDYTTGVVNAHAMGSDGDDLFELVSDPRGIGREAAQFEIDGRGGDDKVDIDLRASDGLNDLNVDTDVGTGSNLVTTNLDFRGVSARGLGGKYRIETDANGGGNTFAINARDIPGIGDVESHFTSEPSQTESAPQREIWIFSGNTTVEGGPNPAVTDYSVETSRDASVAELDVAASDRDTGGKVSIKKLLTDKGFGFVEIASPDASMRMRVTESIDADGSQTVSTQSDAFGHEIGHWLSVPQTFDRPVSSRLAISPDAIEVNANGYLETRLRVDAADSTNIYGGWTIGWDTGFEAHQFQGRLVASTLDDEVRLGIADGRAESIDVQAEGVRQLTRTLENVSILAGGTYSEEFASTERGDDYRLAVDGLVIEPGATFEQKLFLLDGDTGVVDAFDNVTNYGDFRVDVQAAAGANRIAYVDSYFENYGLAKVRIAGGGDADRISYQSLGGRIAPGASAKVSLDGRAGPDAIDAAIDGLLVEENGEFDLEAIVLGNDRIRLTVNPDPRSAGDISVSVIKGDDVIRSWQYEGWPLKWNFRDYSARAR